MRALGADSQFFFPWARFLSQDPTDRDMFRYVEEKASRGWRGWIGPRKIQDTGNSGMGQVMRSHMSLIFLLVWRQKHLVCLSSMKFLAAMVCPKSKMLRWDLGKPLPQQLRSRKALKTLSIWRGKPGCSVSPSRGLLWTDHHGPPTSLCKCWEDVPHGAASYSYRMVKRSCCRRLTATTPGEWWWWWCFVAFLLYAL